MRQCTFRCVTAAYLTIKVVIAFLFALSLVAEWRDLLHMVQEEKTLDTITLSIIGNELRLNIYLAIPHDVRNKMLHL